MSCWATGHLGATIGPHVQLHVRQVVEELFTYWNLDKMDDELEQLEELLIVRAVPPQLPGVRRTAT